MSNRHPDQIVQSYQEAEKPPPPVISHDSKEVANPISNPNVPNSQAETVSSIRNQLIRISEIVQNVSGFAAERTQEVLLNCSHVLSTVVSQLPPTAVSVEQGSSEIGNKQTTQQNIAEERALLASKRKEEMEKWAKEQEIEEKEQQRELEEKRAKSAEDRRKMMSGFMDTRRKQEEEWRLEVEETNRKMKKKHEELKEKLAKEAEEREKEREVHIAEQEKQILEESQNAEEELERTRAENDRKVQKKNEELVEKQKQHEVVMEEKEKELIFEKERHEETVRRIQEEYERWKAESERKWEERQLKMNKQYEQLMKMLQMQVWNAILETNWTNRLNFLRSANKEVARCLSNLQNSVHLFKTYLQNEDSVKIQSQKVVILSLAKSLMDSVGNEKQLMEKESATLKTMFENTGKQFLRQIRESVDSIVAGCSELNVYLKQFLDELNKEQFSADSCIFTEVCEKSRTLADRSSAIPTLAELKKRFREQMNDSEDNSRRDNEPLFQTVIIEEVD